MEIFQVITAYCNMVLVVSCIALALSVYALIKAFRSENRARKAEDHVLQLLEANKQLMTTLGTTKSALAATHDSVNALREMMYGSKPPEPVSQFPIAS